MLMCVRLVAVERVGAEMLQLGLIVVLGGIGSVGAHLGIVAIDYDLASEFAFPLVEVFLLLERRDSNDLSGDLAGSGWRPWCGLRKDSGRGRRRHQHGGANLLPSHSELTPRFAVNVGGAHAAKLVERPLFRFREVGRASEAWADAIEEAAGIFHDVRVMESLVANARDGGEVECLRRGLGRDGRGYGLFRREGGEGKDKQGNRGNSHIKTRVPNPCAFCKRSAGECQ